ncbi:MAG: hypothetical protein J0H43_16000 [Actinobacteria bacterium]|nr:hypothetical protein [Actinomycetota bacterium]
MRWDGLFADLEAQAVGLESAARAAEVDEHIRGEVARLSVRDRLRGAVGSRLRVGVLGGVPLVGELRRVGPDWLLLREVGPREALVAQVAVVSIGGLGRHSAAPNSMGVVESRLDLRHVLRGIARDRSVVRVQLVDGVTVDATIDRVGADFVEVAVHPAGEPRRRAAVRDVLLLPAAAIAAVRRRESGSV